MHSKLVEWFSHFASGLTANQTIQKRYRPFHYFYKAIGFNAFTFDGNHKPEFSNIGAVYSIIVALGYMGFYSYAVALFSGDMVSASQASNELVKIIDIYSTYSGLVTIMSMIVCSALQQRSLVKAIRLLIEVDTLFARSLATTIDNARWQVAVLGFLTAGMVGVLVMEYLDCIMFISTYIFKTVTNCYTICFIQLLFFVLAEVHIIGHLLLVHDRFAVINERLQHFCNAEDQRVEDLLVMITIYKKLEECHKYFNAAFAFPICLIVTIRSILMATLSYEFVLKLINYDNTTVDYDQFVESILDCFLWTMWMLCEIFFLFFIGHITERQAARTTTVLHFSLRDGENEYIDHLIENLIYKLKYGVITSPYGIFALNMASFMALIAGVMSYLVVLVQLDSKAL